jgi:hypothetical protein
MTGEVAQNLGVCGYNNGANHLQFLKYERLSLRSPEFATGDLHVCMSVSFVWGEVTLGPVCTATTVGPTVAALDGG